MCFVIPPIVAAAVSAAGTLASAAMSSASARAQGRAQERQAGMEMQRGAYEAARVGDQNNRRLDSMRSSYLNSGIALTGSATDILADSAIEASLDEQAIRYGAEVRADNLRFESQMSKMNARSAMVGGVLGATGALVNGMSRQNEFNQQRTLLRNPYTW